MPNCQRGREREMEREREREGERKRERGRERERASSCYPIANIESYLSVKQESRLRLIRFDTPVISVEPHRRMCSIPLSGRNRRLIPLRAWNQSDFP